MRQRKPWRLPQTGRGHIWKMIECWFFPFLNQSKLSAKQRQGKGVRDIQGRAHPEIPWVVIVAMRNRLIHAYFDVDLDRVWDTVVDDLPPLIARLDRFCLDHGAMVIRKGKTHL
jgi:hypothetical protein